MNKKLAKEVYDDGYVEGYKASIAEFLQDLCSLNEFPSLIPFGFEPLRKLIQKWEGRQNGDKKSQTI